VFLLMQLTGTYAVIFYAVSLFKDIGVSTNPYIPAIITGKTLLSVSYSFNVIYPGISSFPSKPAISKGSIQLPPGDINDKKRKSATSPILGENPRTKKAALDTEWNNYTLMLIVCTAFSFIITVFSLYEVYFFSRHLKFCLDLENK
jgi:hypothetical protein